LVTAPAGAGKSRLLQEFLHRVEKRGQRALVLQGQGNPLSVATSYGLLGQALRRVCGIEKGESLETSRARLSARVARHMPAAQAREAAMFLGELCAISFPEEDSPQLRAARKDPRLMSTQVSRALVAFLKAECAHGPVLLILEDLHWSDSATIRLLDEVLRELAEQPLLVLALARPEVKELFPGMWSRFLQELPLRGLSQKAGARLVHEVLGPHVSQDEVARLVEQSMGSALFLEELLRAVAEGWSKETPKTIQAMLLSSLLRLGPLPRRTLRAASMFGHTFWVGGVKAVLERQLSSNEELEKSLRQLTELDLVQQQPVSRFPGEAEYRFRHTLVHDAAHNLVPDSLKPAWQQRASAWLEKAREKTPSPS
jgi:predicted ATPase